MTVERLELLDYDPCWRETYRREAHGIRSCLGSLVYRLYHVGSTSVPGSIARPIVDILVVARRHEYCGQCQQQLFALGYDPVGDGSGCLSKKDDAGREVARVWVLPRGAHKAEHLLVFRDFLRRHRYATHEYNQLKLAFGVRKSLDYNDYEQGKQRFISSMMAAATYDRAG